MCMNAGDPSIDSASSSNQQSITGDINADYTSRYADGIENPTLNWLHDDATFGAVSKRAADNTKQQISAGTEMMARQMGRTGVQLNARQMEALKNKRNLEGSKTLAGQVNLARGAHAEVKDMARNGMIDVGRNVLSNSVDLANTAAGLEQARNQRNTGAVASANASNQQAGMTMLSAAMMFSDKDKKKNITKMDTDDSLKKVRGMKMKNWEYKQDEVAIPGRHPGVIAQESPDQMTNDDKTMINLHDELQLGIGAIQALAKKIDRLEKRSAA